MASKTKMRLRMSNNRQWLMCCFNSLCASPIWSLAASYYRIRCCWISDSKLLFGKNCLQVADVVNLHNRIHKDVKSDIRIQRKRISAGSITSLAGSRQESNDCQKILFLHSLGVQNSLYGSIQFTAMPQMATPYTILSLRYCQQTTSALCQSTV